LITRDDNVARGFEGPCGLGDRRSGCASPPEGAVAAADLASMWTPPCDICSSVAFELWMWNRLRRGRDSRLSGLAVCVSSADNSGQMVLIYLKFLTKD